MDGGRLCAWLVLVGFAVRTTLALCETRPLSEALVVPADDACLTPGSVAAEVADRLRRDVVDARLSIILRRDASAVTFVVRRDGQVTVMRRISPLPPTCDDLRSLVALTVALAVDATLLDRKTPPTPARQPGATVRTSGSRVAAVAEVFAASGIVPEGAFGAALGAELGPAGSPTVRLAGFGTAPVRTSVDTGAATLSLIGLRADLCVPVLFAHRALDGRLCGGALGGRMNAAGTGFERPHFVQALWFAAAARAELRLALSSFVAVHLGGEVLFPVVRPRFDILGRNRVRVDSLSLPGWGVAGFTGAGFHFH